VKAERFLPILVRLARALPHRAALGLGGFLGALFWAFSKRRVDRAEARCVSALGVGVTRARKIVRSSYINLGKSVMEFSRVKCLRANLSSWVSIEGKEHLDRALARGKGVLVLSAHIGNWELGAARMTAEGYALAPLYTPQRNDGGLETLISALRAEEGEVNFIVSDGPGLRGIFRALRGGRVLVFMHDLDARKEGVVLPFLGLPASCAAGIVKMHKRSGAPVVPIVALRNPDGIHHTIRVEGILSDLPDEDGEPFGVNIGKSLKMCNNSVARWVTRYPEQWLWLLDKWESASPRFF
jgi:KDO2-lipid IV(A) lauroyltransferase